tara:strand:- start:1663 stop:2937 length:1275 start_codon:yes stop_codon:yes gene_type:complete
MPVGSKWTKDYGRSRDNALFNWQPFALIELKYEDLQKVPVKKTQDGYPKYQGDIPTDQLPIGYHAPLGAEAYASRLEPWLMEEHEDNVISFRRKPANSRSRALSLAQPKLLQNQVSNAKVPKTTTEGSRIFQADVVLRENYTQTMNVTSYPVDKLGNISDHSMLKDFKISISAMHSATIISYTDIDSNIFNTNFATGLDEFLTSDDEETPKTRIQYIYDLLMEWQLKGTPLAVKTKFALTGIKDKKDNQMIPFTISNLSIPRNKDNGNAINVSFTLQRIKQVSLGETTIVTYDTVDNVKYDTREKAPKKKTPKPKGGAQEGDDWKPKDYLEDKLKKNGQTGGTFDPSRGANDIPNQSTVDPRTGLPPVGGQYSGGPTPSGTATPTWKNPPTSKVPNGPDLNLPNDVSTDGGGFSASDFGIPGGT